MKTYHEMIQFVVDKVDDGTLRYNEWQPVLTLSEAYGIPQDVVFSDVKFEKEFREAARKEKRKVDSRAANEERRLANLAKKETT